MTDVSYGSGKSHRGRFKRPASRIDPAENTDTPFPLQYSVVVLHPQNSVTLYPGLGESLTTQPYFLVRTI